MDCRISDILRDHISVRHLNHLAINQPKGAMENPQKNAHICHLSMSQVTGADLYYLRARFVGLEGTTIGTCTYDLRGLGRIGL
jgi:hypothetical protein